MRKPEQHFANLHLLLTDWLRREDIDTGGEDPEHLALLMEHGARCAYGVRLHKGEPSFREFVSTNELDDTYFTHVTI